MPCVLLTGGTGYIGSHTCVELMAAGWSTVVVDNLCNSSRGVIDRVARIAGRRPAFVEADIRDARALDRVFGEFPIDAVMHFAGLKAVAESVEQPLHYYENNVGGTMVLVDAMQRHGVKRIVFSSSATVYAPSKTMPLREDAALGPVNPYGRSKLVIEQILADVASADREWRVMLLRYFNPVGAHSSGLIGEDPVGVPNNLMPYVAQVASGKRPRVSIFGKDYPTPDGTGVRDYIHVSDLAQGHVAALSRLGEERAAAATTINLGTGRGHSVLDVLRHFETACGRRIPFDFAARRPGDVAICYADASLAQKLLGWQARRSLGEMCTDSWRWQSSNPNGFRD